MLRSNRGDVPVPVRESFYSFTEASRSRSTRSPIGNVGDAVREATNPTPIEECAITRSFDAEHRWRSRGERAIREEMERRIKARLERGRGRT